MNDSAVAISASGITFGFSIRRTDKKEVVSFSSEVYPYFYPDQSWFKIQQADDHILGQEQLYFDFTELYACKFRYRICLLKLTNDVRVELNKIHTYINVKLSQMQNKYDNETDYSRNFEAQSKWRIYVDADLKKYLKYKSVD